MSDTTEAPAAPYSAAGLDPALIGTWQLMSAEDKQGNTWVPGTFGTPPSGYFIYDATGHASVQIMFIPPVQLSDPGNGPTPAEALKIVNSYIAYYGPYTTSGNTVTVTPVGNLDPTQVGVPQPRPYKVVGDELIIGSREDGYIRTLKRL